MSTTRYQSTADTIVACATARHSSAIAVIRLSGPQSHAIAKQMAGKLTPPRIASLVKLRDTNGEIQDQVLQLLFCAPASFTGEDMVEWHCHGGVLLVDLLLEQVLSLGAREATPGEFSKRAFLNGKLDLSQAEAIAELIEAGSRRVARLAASSLAGGLAHPLACLIEVLDWCRIQVEARLDFSDEEIDPADLIAIRQRLNQQQDDLQALMRRADNNLRYAHSPKVLLIGEPNTGKSSLFNRLVGEKRALVSEHPGTTRDILRESVRFGDATLRLCDSAGLRDSADGIEQAGIQLTHAQVAESDVLLVVFDARQAPPHNLLQQLESMHNIEQPAIPRVCFLANKIDLDSHNARIDDLILDEQHYSCIWLSAATGAGLGLLRDWLVKATNADLNMEESGEMGDAFLVRQRHLVLLNNIATHLANVDMHLALGEARLELAAESLRLARVEAGQLTGQNADEELLGRIFSQFCIGK